MLRDLVEYLFKLGAESSKFKCVDAVRQGYVDGATGKVVYNNVPPDFRSHVVFSLEALVQAAKQFAAKATKDAPPSVWYHRTGVTMLVDDTVRRDAVKLHIMTTPQWDWLVALQAKDPVFGTLFDQRQLAWALRTVMRDCVQAGVIAAVRNIEWKTGESGASSVGHGTASYGKQIEAQLVSKGGTAAATLPETFTASVIPFSTPTYVPAVSVELALEPNPNTQNFNLLPRPGALEAALQASEAAIGAYIRDGLKDTVCLVHYGKP